MCHQGRPSVSEQSLKTQRLSCHPLDLLRLVKKKKKIWLICFWKIGFLWKARIWSHPFLLDYVAAGVSSSWPQYPVVRSWLTQEARPSKVDDGSKDSLTALKQWTRQKWGKFWAWSNTEYYCLISHLWWRHSGKKMQLDIPNGIPVAWSLMIFTHHKGSCKVVSWTM